MNVTCDYCRGLKARIVDLERGLDVTRAASEQAVARLEHLRQEERTALTGQVVQAEERALVLERRLARMRDVLRTALEEV